MRRSAPSARHPTRSRAPWRSPRSASPTGRGASPMGSLDHAAQLTLAPGWDSVRLFLHVLAATIWVGGQFVMLGLLPTGRSLGGEATKSLAGAFARLSWPAFVVLVLTGFWNLAA